MENSPRKSLPLNFSISDLLFGSLYPPTSSNLVFVGQNKMFAQDLKSSAQASTAKQLNMDNSTGRLTKTKNTFFQNVVGVFDSITNMVSRVSNITSALNNTLSVTVVPNDDISSQYLIQNLTERHHHHQHHQESLSSVNNYTTMLDDMKNKSMYDLKNNNNHHITQQVYTAQVNNFPHHKFADVNLAKDPIDHFYDDDFKQIVERSDLELAIEESLKHMKSYNPCNNSDNYSELIKTSSKPADANKATEKMISRDDCPGDLKEFDDNLVYQDAELLKKKLIPSKMRRKTSTICRAKNRSKIQLKKSGVSQLKNRKERLRQNIYSTIQEDLDVWESEQNDSTDEQSTSITSDDEDQKLDEIINASGKEQCATMLIESFRLGDHMRIGVDEAPEETSLENSKHSSSDFVPICDNKGRRSSTCSVDSDDSSFIVFEDDSDSDDDDDDDDDDDEGGSEDDEDDSSDESTISDDEDEKEEDEKDKKSHERLKSSLQVRFNLKPTIYTIIKWDEEYRAARKGPWEEFARDRERFKGRISRLSLILEPVLTSKHRDCIWKNRFASQQDEEQVTEEESL